MAEQAKSQAQGGESAGQALNIELIPNGPIVVLGTVSIKNSEGTVTEKTDKTFLCRCGGSANKPYCDGKHRKIDFKG